MSFLIHISCSAGKAEQEAYRFCLETLQHDLKIYRIFFSGEVVTSALKETSAWAALCESNDIDAVCCSSSVDKHREFDTASQSNALKEHSSRSAGIKTGGLALLVEGAIKSSSIVNFTDSNDRPAYTQLKNENKTSEFKTQTDCDFTLSLEINDGTKKRQKRDTNYDYHRFQRLIDTASVFLVFEQNFNIHLDIAILQSTNNKALFEDFKTLSELGLKNLYLFSNEQDNDNLKKNEPLSYIVTQLKTIGVNCNHQLHQSKRIEHMANDRKHLKF